MNSTLTKIIELSDFAEHNEPRVQLVRPHEFNTKLAHIKTASEAMDYIKGVKPVPNKTLILVLAMTAGEFYGANRNGDAWPERPLRVGPTDITADDVLPKHYKTFETNANVFRHHINKDPEKRIGQVMKAFYNWPMHRVELLLALDNNAAEDVVQEVESGKFPAVSMGCKVRFDVCFAEKTPIATDTGLRQIESVEVGTLVRTHTGQLRRVKETFQRRYSGSVYYVYAQGIPAVHGVTENHPLYVLRREQLRNCWGSTNKDQKRRCTPNDQGVCRVCGNTLPDPQWVPAKDIEIGDYVVCPVPTPKNMDVSPAMAYVLGAYLGDGCVYSARRGKQRNGEYEDRGLRFEIGYEHPQVLDRLETALRQVHGKDFYVANLKKDDGRRDTALFQIYDKALAQEAIRICGAGSRTKFVNEEVLHWSHAARLAFVGGYLDTDGCIDPKKGNARFVSTSESVAFGIQSVLASVGMPASTHHETVIGEYTKQPLDVWVVSLGTAYVRRLADVSGKAAALSRNRRVKDEHIVIRNMLCARVTKIETEEVTDMAVYNLAVEEDESYVAGWFAAHNCSICGNCAPSRKEYCDHAKYQLGDLLSNGKRVFVWNPSPKFFDISMVRRPADRLGFMMKKVAEAVPEIYSSADLGEYAERMSRKVANLRKLSLIHKILKGVISATKNDSGEVREIKNFGDQVATPAAKQMPPIPDETIKQLVHHRPAEVLATLSSLGILLTTPEFIKYFVWRIDPDMEIPEDELDRAVAAQQHVFELLAENPKILDEIDELGYLSSDTKNIDEGLARKVQSLIEKRSQSQDWILHRMLKTAYTPGDFDLVDVTDPNTGEQYQTTEGEIRRSQGAVQKQYRKNILGGAAMLAGGLAMLPIPGLRYAAPLLLNPGSRRMMAPSEPQSVSTPYGKVYGPGQTPEFRGFKGTALVEKQSEATEPDLANATIRLAMDLQHRPRARGKKIAMLLDGGELSFEQAAKKIGELICL